LITCCLRNSKAILKLCLNKREVVAECSCRTNLHVSMVMLTAYFVPPERGRLIA
jgi:hypothetical protein